MGAEETGWRIISMTGPVIYTFVEQIRRHGLDPCAYFEWVFEKLMRMSDPSPAELEELLPVNWVAARRKKSEETRIESASEKGAA